MSTRPTRDPPAPDAWEALSLAAGRITNAPPDAELPISITNIEGAKVGFAGRFHFTMLVRNRPRTLDTWRVTTASLLTADRVAQLLGGYIQQVPTRGQTEIRTASSTVGILLTGADALFIWWQRIDQGTCDGATQDNCQPCSCPSDFGRRRATAKQGHGCRPLAEVRFRLQDDQTAGIFGLASEDWSFVELVTTTRAVLSGRETERPVRARLGLRRTLHTVSRGLVLPYTRPAIDVSPPSSISLSMSGHDDQEMRET